MNNFFINFFSSLLALTVFSIGSMFLVVLFIVAVVMALDTKIIPDTKPNSVLTITLEETVEDRPTEDLLGSIDIQNFSKKSTLGLNDIVAAIGRAKTDENISGIYLAPGEIDAGITSVGEIRKALADFRESGKFVYTHADYLSQKAYFLVSLSDRIDMMPTGDLEFVGLSLQVMFYKNALEKLGVEPQVIRHGKYKGAVEPFILDRMSVENNVQMKSLAQSMWNSIVPKIAESREIPVATLNGYADTLAIATAGKAVEYGLIDGIKYKDEAHEELARLLGVSSSDDIESVALSSYIAKIKEDVPAVPAEDRIALIYAVGSMEMGSGSSTTIGSVGLSEAIARARKDESVKAIVLRINSPGGDALAAEIILREVKLARDTKPVVVSMGEYAASGGYYIACAADKIFASENTLTGSIGVFGIFFNADELLSGKLGITVEAVNTHAHSDIDGFYRSMNGEELRYMQHRIDGVYTQFSAHVAEGRKMEAEAVEKIAQGRVWSGNDALEIGLVDRIGGLDLALAEAAELAGIAEYSILELPEMKGPFEQVLETVSSGVRSRVFSRAMDKEIAYFGKVRDILSVRGIQARVPYTLEIN